MASILSQEEVDALLKSFQEEDDPEAADALSQDGESGEGEGAASQVRLYDFRRPNRISKEQIRFLQTLHEGYAFRFGGILSGYLRTMVEISVVRLEQLSYGEWIKGLDDETCLFPFGMNPLEGFGVIEMDPMLVLGFVDRLLGGQGEVAETDRELTHLETTVVSRVVEDGLKILGETWKEVVPIEPVLHGQERQVHLLRLLDDTEPILLVTFDLKTKVTRGRMTICYPFVPFEPGLANVTSVNVARPLERTRIPEAAAWLQSGLEEARVPVSVCLGKGMLTIGEFIHLHSGDVIRLHAKLDDPVTIQVAGRPKFTARPGRIDRKMAVRVDSGLTGIEGGEPNDG